MKKVILSLAISSLSVSSCFAMSATESRDLCKPTQNQSDISTYNLYGQDKTPLRSLAYEEEILYNTCSIWNDVRLENSVPVESGQIDEELSDSSTLCGDVVDAVNTEQEANPWNGNNDQNNEALSVFSMPRGDLVGAVNTEQEANPWNGNNDQNNEALSVFSMPRGDLVGAVNTEQEANPWNGNNDQNNEALSDSSTLCGDMEEKESGEFINSVPLNSNAVLNDQRRSGGESSTIRVALAGGVTIAVFTYCGWKGFEHLSGSAKTLFTDVAEKLGQNSGRIKPIAGVFQFIKSKARNAIPEPESVLKKIASATGNAVYTGILALPNIVERGIKISFEIIKYLIKQTTVLLGY